MNYLPHIAKLQKAFAPLDFEVSVGGGLAYDAFVGKLTRSHDDLDIDIIGKDKWKIGFPKVADQIFALYPDISTVKKGRIIVEKGRFVINIEYVQEIDPTKNRYHYADGEFAYPVTAYLHRRGKIGKSVFTIENPHFLFAIKLLQPILGKKGIRPKDVHDLALVRPSLDKNDLIKCAEYELTYFKAKN